MKLRRFFRSISIHSTFLFGTCGHQLNKKLQRTTTESSAEGQDASKAAEGSNHKKPREAKETKRRGPLLARCRERERNSAVHVGFTMSLQETKSKTESKESWIGIDCLECAFVFVKVKVEWTSAYT